MPRATLKDLLVPGITGSTFRVEPQSPKLLDEFKRRGHEAARAVAGNVSAFVPAACGRNYFSMEIAAPGREREHLLLHAVLPILAAVSEPGFRLIFVPMRRLDPFFDDLFLIPEPALLNQRLDRAALDAAPLRKQELYDIEYWTPERVGDLVFNHFD
jgi:hypothetical protein